MFHSKKYILPTFALTVLAAACGTESFEGVGALLDDQNGALENDLCFDAEGDVIACAHSNSNSNSIGGHDNLPSENHSSAEQVSGENTQTGGVDPHTQIDSLPPNVSMNCPVGVEFHEFVEGRKDNFASAMHFGDRYAPTQQWKDYLASRRNLIGFDGDGPTGGTPIYGAVFDFEHLKGRIVCGTIGVRGKHLSTPTVGSSLNMFLAPQSGSDNGIPVDQWEHVMKESPDNFYHEFQKPLTSQDMRIDNPTERTFEAHLDFTEHEICELPFLERMNKADSSAYVFGTGRHRADYLVMYLGVLPQ